MSVWPEHPWYNNPIAKERVEAAMLRLAEGPPISETPRHYVVGLTDDKFGTADFHFYQARWIYFPDAGAPTHLLVWTPSSSHIFDYHDINHCFIGP